MAVIAPRDRVIDTFAATHLAEAGRPMINDTDEYSILKGKYVYKRKEETSIDPYIVQKYEEYLEMLD